MPDDVLPWRRRPPRRVATRTFLSPAVRAAAAARGVDVTSLQGSGLDGRVTRDDVARMRDEVVPLNNVQRRAGAHLLRSSRIAAQAFVAIEVDFEDVDVVRRVTRLTFLPFVARAVVDAITRHPWVNATVDDDGYATASDRVHLGIAVDLSHEGLVVPVVRDAQDRRLVALAHDVADIARRARAKQLSPDDVTGGTFTITNPGPAGTAVSVPIINQPQVAILSTDGVARRPVVVQTASGRDTIDTRATGVLGLSFDHRVVDVAYAAAFLRDVRDVLETRDWFVEASLPRSVSSR
ncbi:MAG TPA: 2-oxo acid dehydrogenase subunit E2 [Acidimicrobiia bacterium]|nr:2-oxo acid dehydrogenase subunit E2 [Acidimicrobiia bacterium]